MAEDKEIKIRAILDAQAFDKSVNEIQMKLKRMAQESSQLGQAQGNLKGTNVLGKYAQQAFGDFSKESQGQLEKMFQSQRREAVHQKINMKEKQQELEKLAKTDEKLNKQQKERVELLKKELDLIKEKHRHTLTEAGQTQKMLQNIKEQAGGGQAGGIRGALRDMIGSIGPAALASGAINAIMTGSGDIISRERRITQARGSSLTGAARGLREQFQGRGSRGMFWAGERAEAAGMAATEAGRQDFLTGLKTAGSTVLGGIGGALVGGAVGTAIAPGPGTIAGAIKGGITGATAGFGGTMLGSEKARSQIFDRERFRAIVGKEGMQNYESNVEAIKAKSPRAKFAQEYFEQNRGNIADLQMSLGIGDEGMFGEGGTIQKQRQAGSKFGGPGFQLSNIQSQIRGIIGAGGTSGAGRELGGFSAGLQRQMGLGNSQQILGKLSGAGLDSLETETATKKLLAEAVKIGVDTSKMPQEMMRMTAMTAQLATANGGFAPGAVEVAMAGVQGFDKMSIEAAGSAAQKFKKTGKMAGGYEGQMGLGFLQSGKTKKMLGGKELDAKDLNLLNQTSYTDLDEEGFQSLADYLGVTPKQVKEVLKKKDLYKQTKTASAQKAIESLGGYLKSQGPMTSGELSKIIGSGKGAKLFQKAKSEMGAVQSGLLQGTQVSQQSSLMQLANLSTPGLELPGPTAGEAVEGLMGKPEGRAAFMEEGSIAAGEGELYKAINNNLTRLKNAAQAHAENVEVYNKQFEAMSKHADGTAGGLKNLNTVLDGLIEDMAEKGYIVTKPAE